MGHLLLGMSLHLSVVYIPSETSLDKNNFSFESDYELVIVPG